MKINPQLIEYMNKEASALVELVKVSPINNGPIQILPQQKRETGAPEPLVKLSNVKHIRQVGELGIRQAHNGQIFGFDKDTVVRFEKFLTNILKSKEINTVIGRKFLNEQAWKWILETKSSGKASTVFTENLISKMESSIKDYTIFFHLLNVNIRHAFQVGNASFGNFDEQFFDKYLTHPELQRNSQGLEDYKSLKRKYQDTSYVSCTVKGESNKAKSIALEICSLSMDVLKICSPTLEHPQFRLDFDIDNRIARNPFSEYFLESSKLVEGLTIHLVNDARPFLFDDREFELFGKRGLNRFNEFVNGLTDNQSKLEEMIVRGIKSLAKALTTVNHNQRITELFSLLESLLVTRKEEPLTETVGKYTSKLITKDKEKRREIIKLLKKMYEVRSQWVHYAVEETFDLNELKDLQRIVHALLIVLIVKSRTHKTKDTILAEIDDAILGAY